MLLYWNGKENSSTLAHTYNFIYIIYIRTNIHICYYLDRQTVEEGRRAQWLKHCDSNNRDEGINSEYK